MKRTGDIASLFLRYGSKKKVAAPFSPPSPASAAPAGEQQTFELVQERVNEEIVDSPPPSLSPPPPPPPPPPNMAQIMLMQTQILQQLAANVANQNQGQPPQSGFAEFMRAKPPTFEGSADPLDADDWLKDIRKTLNLANCTVENRVKFAAHQLKGVAADWWENYCEAHEDAQTITWNEFAEAFRTTHIPAGIMELKRDEFRALTQGKMTMSEYLSRFTQLACYGRADIPTEADKTAKFLKGLNPGLKDMRLSTRLYSRRTQGGI